jgi:DNA-binding transcriptional MerR regulator
VAPASAAPAFDRAPVTATLREAERPGQRLKKADDTSAAPGMRMKDLTRETGLPRETIHFYLTQGLLPPGNKTGRNTAEYGPEHLARLHRIRDLQAKHFLPLRAIKALLEDELASENLTPEQEALLTRVRATLPEIGRNAGETVPLAEAAGQIVSAGEIDELREGGIIEVIGRGASARVSSDDAEILRAWAAAREAGIGPDHGFHAIDLGLFDNAVRRLVKAEVKRFSQAYADRPTHEVTEVLQKALPLVERLLTVMHQKHVRRALTEDTPSDEN